MKAFASLSSSRLLPLSAALLASLWLAGCGSNVKLDENASKPPVESRNIPGQGDNTSSNAASTVAPVVASQDDAGAKAQDLPRVIYFDFDSFNVKDEFRPVLERHAKILNTVRSKRVFVEGHTDERGGREYNLALGQKRAEAVVKSLTLLGVNGEQLEAVSYGEERPAAAGSDEEAWAKNRRAEIKDR